MEDIKVYMGGVNVRQRTITWYIWAELM